MPHNYHRMQIYGRAVELAAAVYRLTQRFLREELFGLTSQIRRAAISVSLNIAEGSGGSSNREFARFLDIALRSLYETNASLEVACRLGFVPEVSVADLRGEIDELGAMISAFRGQLGQRAGRRARVALVGSVFCSLCSVV